MGSFFTIYILSLFFFEKTFSENDAGLGAPQNSLAHLTATAAATGKRVQQKRQTNQDPAPVEGK